ncbi:inactive hydroxysteroid dehydrogenase-like protein 1 isoform X2 [Numenius arquata]|uniref:inactive hydroxysteroid dehydrogenase-like protein 1 isoform X2 n=1 Tax=Numenius arquata TaxID=31919 RepID=UPI003D30C8FC
MAAVDRFYLLYREISRSCSFYIEALAIVGAWYTVRKCVSLAFDTYSMLRLHLIPKLGGEIDLVKRYGKWAVVTGSTDGIGKAYAEELAKRGVNIILISRNKEKLEYFTNLSEDVLWDMININIVSANMMMHIVLPRMVEKKRGAIVNVSSASCCQPTPMLTIYGASKTYLDYFSRALHYEYASKGIFVQSLTPFVIATKMVACSSTASKRSFFFPSAEEYASHAVSTLGLSTRTTGYWKHAIKFTLGECIPEWIWAWFAMYFGRIIRKEALTCKMK